MDRGEREIPMHGGRVTQGVVRVAGTIRRPPTSNSTFMQALLRHLEAAGFAGAPRSLGSDERGRDVLSYIDGEVPRDLGWHSDEILAAAARLIRAYHDATGPLLRSGAARAAGLDIVCHNDLSPCNFVFRNGQPVAIIDFDAAAPGSRLHDLGYAAWMWLDLGNAEIDTDLQRRRLGHFCAAYDSDLDVSRLVGFVRLRQRILISEGQRLGNGAMEQWAADCLEWTSRHGRSLA